MAINSSRRQVRALVSDPRISRIYLLALLIKFSMLVLLCEKLGCSTVFPLPTHTSHLTPQACFTTFHPSIGFTVAQLGPPVGKSPKLTAKAQSSPRPRAIGSENRVRFNTALGLALRPSRLCGESNSKRFARVFWFSVKWILLSQLLRDRGELLQGGLKVVGDLLG